MTLESKISLYPKLFQSSTPSGKRTKWITRFLSEQKKWKIKLEEKRKMVRGIKAKIKNREVHATTLFALFAVAMVFSLITLIILTPLAWWGIAIRAPFFMWGTGIGAGLFGIAVGTAAIRSTMLIHRQRDEIERLWSEKKHLKALLSKRHAINLLMNFEKLSDWNLIDLSAEEHLKLIQQNFWEDPFFIHHLEDLEFAEQYIKNGLTIPKDLQIKMQQGFAKLTMGIVH